MPSLLILDTHRCLVGQIVTFAPHWQFRRMNLISAENITKSFGDKILFTGISFGLNEGDKTAIIAKNGAGKSTLISLIRGTEVPDSGLITKRKALSIGFLEQEPVFDDSLSVMQALLQAENPISDLIRKYNECLEGKSNHELHQVIEEMNLTNAWDYESKVHEALNTMHLQSKDQLVASLSGGERKKLALARLFLEKPDIMVLDEPTNHLDIPMIEWMEEEIASSKKSLLLVTHDRYFLDSVCNQILELENGKLYNYKGNYSYFLEKKEERLSTESAEYSKTKNTYKKELEWIRKMPKARGVKAKARVQSFSVLKEKMNVKGPDQKIALSFKMENMGSKILEMTKISKKINEKELFHNFTYTFRKNDKIGVCGPNGCGKTSLLKIIQGLDSDYMGKIQIGETIRFGFYSQTGMQFNPDMKVIEVVTTVADFIPLANGTILSAARLLNRFNFPNSTHYQNIQSLSGGELKRLYLLQILMKNPNFLILDEPTNDLDIITLQTLEEFLIDFSGCILIVSHDRFFMDKIVQTIFAFEEDGNIRNYPGNYTEYRNNLDEAKIKQLANSQNTEKEEETENAGGPPISSHKKVKGSKNELEKLEKEINTLEKTRRELEIRLSDINLHHSERDKIGLEVADVIKQCEEKTFRWMELQP